MDADTTPTAGRLRLRAGAATSTGHRRRCNEDAHAIGGGVVAVADGMGGHAAGEVAATVAVATVIRELSGPVPTPAAIQSAVASANRAIRAEARRGGTAGMGATLVGATVIRTETDPLTDATDAIAAIAVFHVGDSRCYRLAAGVLRQVTRDHSLVQQLVDAGRLDAADAATHPMANVVTRALGPDADVVADIALLGAEPGRLLLCSDGLSDALPARTIGRVLAGIADPQAAADRLVELVLAGAARDNVTALVVDPVIESVSASVLDTTARLDHHGAAEPGREIPCRA